MFRLLSGFFSFLCYFTFLVVPYGQSFRTVCRSGSGDPPPKSVFPRMWSPFSKDGPPLCLALNPPVTLRQAFLDITPRFGSPSPFTFPWFSDWLVIRAGLTFVACAPRSHSVFWLAGVFGPRTPCWRPIPMPEYGVPVLDPSPVLDRVSDFFTLK